MKSLDDYVYIKENAFKKSQELIDYLNKLGRWRDSTIVGGAKHPARTSSQFILSPAPNPSPTMVKFVTKIRSTFKEALTEYLEPYKNFCTITGEESFSVLRYEVGGEYKPHSDGDTGNLHRRVSGLLYLNGDFEGGELHFPNTDMKIKPEAGKLVLFPSNFCYVHASTPIISGTKFCVVSWFR